MDTVQGVLSPIQWLPHEMLAEIFLCYVETADRLHPTPGPPPPLLLGHICSTWRNIVHSTPELWTSFSLLIGYYYDNEKAVDHLSFTKAWLERAHPYPLHVSLGIDIDTEKFSRILDAILPSANRLQHLSLNLPFSHFRPLVDLAAGSMPLLESVSLSVTDPGDRGEPTVWMERITAFLTSPHLRSVAIFSLYGYGLINSRLPMPWSQLTALDLREDNSNLICWDILSKCTNLVECVLAIGLSVEGVIPHTPILVLPHLQKLWLVCSEPEDPPLFQYLNCPALKDLTIEGNPWFHQIFMEFASRSSLDLERLRLLQVGIRLDQLLQLLAHMQSLVELDIDRLWCVNNSLIYALHYCEEDDHPLLPKLKTLHISDAWGDQIDDNLIASIIKSR